MQDHIVKSFDIEIARLKENLMDMVQTCENQLEKAIQSLKIMDHDLAGKVVENDKKINAMQRKIETMAVEVLARRQPVAVDLRQLLCIMRMTSELERIGDYAANVAKRVSRLSQAPAQIPRDLIITMANTGRIMLHEAGMAFLMLDMKKAVAVWEKDDDIDADYSKLMPVLNTDMQNHPDRVEDGTHLIFMARCCERIGDHITNIAEDIYYIISGKNFLGQFDID